VDLRVGAGSGPRADSMARPIKRRPDHHGQPLPAGVYAERGSAGEITGYRIRWREATAPGAVRHYARSFSAKRCGSLDDALRSAAADRRRALRVAERARAPLSVDLKDDEDPASRMTVNELFAEWRQWREPVVSRPHRKRMRRYWREITARPLGRVRLERIARDPALLLRFQDQLITEGVGASTRRETLKALRCVLRFGRRRHPNTLNIELSDLFELPKSPRRRLAFVTDAYGLERIMEAVAARPVRDEICSVRDVALVAAMGFAVASRPSEWLYSARWRDLHERSVEFQQGDAANQGLIIGLKSGARAALLLAAARERLSVYREALEDRFGEQPPHALVFQALGPEGPLWVREGDEDVPLAWTRESYLNWTSRVWRPARERAALAPDVDPRIAKMRFYDCRHTAISMALHSKLVVNEHGMNLHSLAAWAGHDVQTLQGYYAHVIARYLRASAIDLEAECAAARERVRAEPSEHLADWRQRARGTRRGTIRDQFLS
jgi:hypothetical protein